MLTQAELTDARDTLSAAKALIASVRARLLSGGDINAARLLNGAIGILSDEIAALDKAIQGTP